MIVVLVDAELILGFLLNNEYASDAEKVLLLAAEGQIEIYITEICLDKIRSEDERRTTDKSEELELEQIFCRNIIRYDNCCITQEVFTFIKSLRHFESAVEIDCAKSYNLNAIITHKPEDWLGSDLPVWSVTELLAVLYLNRCLQISPSQSSLFPFRFDENLPENQFGDYENISFREEEESLVPSSQIRVSKKKD